MDEFIQQLANCLLTGRIEPALASAQKSLSIETISQAEAGDALGKAALVAYNRFAVKSVELFFDSVLTFMPEAAILTFKPLIEPHILLTHEWKKKLADLYMERIGREIYEAVRTGLLDKALFLCAELFSQENLPEGKMRVASILGNIFGAIENRQDEVAKTIRKIRELATKWDLSEDVLAHIDKTTKDRFAMMYKTQLDRRSIQWNRVLSTTIAEIKKHLPLTTSIGEPTEEDLANLRSLIYSIIRCYYIPPHEHIWEDIVCLLVELCPREVSTTGAAAGVESRLFNSMTPLQKRTSIAILTELGENENLVNEIIGFAKAHKGDRYEQYAIEILGGFKADSSIEFLIESMKDKNLIPMRPVIISALGAMSGSKAKEVLLAILKAAMRVSSIEPRHRAEIAQILMALARISRNKILSPEQRNGLIREVIEILGNKDARLNIICAENFYLTQLNDINRAFRAWAVQRLVEGLWLKETDAEFAKGPQAGGESARTFLGRREKLVEHICRFGSDFLPEIIEVAGRYMIHYSGAYLAIGEIMSRIGDERALPLMEKMLSAALLTEDANLQKYEQEHYWDASTETRQVLGKDKIAATLVYAMNKIGGERADCILWDIYEKIQTGHYNMPGKETAEMIFKAHSRIEKESKEKGENICAPVVPSDVPAAYDVDDAIRALTKYYFFTGADKKRLKKIAALQLLGRAKSPEAIKPVITQMKDSDPLIASAAVSALVEYNTPPMPPFLLHEFLHNLILEWNSAPPQLKRKIEDIINKLRADRDVMKSRIRQAIEMEREPKVRFAMEKIFAPYMAAQAMEKEPGTDAPNGAPNGISSASKSTNPLTARLSELEQKRLYLEARKKWIAGGKKGDPPKLEDFSIAKPQ
ncbi:MAG: hypothetical protein BWY12_01280 [candidate division BRC1 bacterium ADurb.Bin183]|nr:MAG: hypothetical protein BWY12_01280 [candidate division BRC1 bacterium ADurb.Bin183]